MSGFRLAASAEIWDRPSWGSPPAGCARWRTSTPSSTSRETAVLEGVPDHRDSVLDEDEKAANDCMMICVSRACTPRLALDLQRNARRAATPPGPPVRDRCRQPEGTAAGLRAAVAPSPKQAGVLRPSDPAYAEAMAQPNRLLGMNLGGLPLAGRHRERRSVGLIGIPGPAAPHPAPDLYADLIVLPYSGWREFGKQGRRDVSIL
jgi:hypothetical protein